MSFNENGQNENKNWKIQNQTHTQHNFKGNIKQSTTINSDGSDVFNATSDDVVGNKPQKNSDSGDANVRSGVTTFRTDFSGLFASKCCH